MQHRTTLKLIAAAGLAGSCASAAMMTPADPPVAEAVGVTFTPVVVDAGGRITPASETAHAEPMPASGAEPVPTEPAPEPASAEPAVLEEAEGEATYYASRFDGRRSASGVVFRNAEAYAAHRTYPFGTIVRITSLANDRSAIVRIIDRGPHGTSARARRTIIDVSQSVARELDFMRAGRIPVRVEVLEWGTGRK